MKRKKKRNPHHRLNIGAAAELLAYLGGNNSDYTKLDRVRDSLVMHIKSLAWRSSRR